MCNDDRIHIIENGARVFGSTPLAGEPGLRGPPEGARGGGGRTGARARLRSRLERHGALRCR